MQAVHKPGPNRCGMPGSVARTGMPDGPVVEACGTAPYPPGVLKVIAALVPSAGMLFLFWLALKSLIEADRRERAAEAKLRRAEREAQQEPVEPARSAPDPGTASGGSVKGESDHGSAAEEAGGDTPSGSP